MAEPLACVVRGVEASRVEAGQTVAVIGAGPIGLMFVALARLRGARVVAVGRNARPAAARRSSWAPPRRSTPRARGPRRSCSAASGRPAAGPTW